MADIRLALCGPEPSSDLRGRVMSDDTAQSPARDGGRRARLTMERPDSTDELVRCLPDACVYYPATVLVQAWNDGAALAYDAVASAVSVYRDEEAQAVAEHFDTEVLTLLRRVADPR